MKFGNWCSKSLTAIISPVSEEVALVRRFSFDSEGVLNEMILHFNNRKTPFKRSLFGKYSSDYEMITVFNDMYGYEVRIYPEHELLDCCPIAYGLTRKQALLLYNAILSNVPGSILFVDRTPRKQGTNK